MAASVKCRKYLTVVGVYVRVEMTLNLTNHKKVDVQRWMKAALDDLHDWLRNV